MQVGADRVRQFDLVPAPGQAQKYRLQDILGVLAATRDPESSGQNSLAVLRQGPACC